MPFFREPEESKRIGKARLRDPGPVHTEFSCEAPYSPQDKQKLLTQFIEDERKRYESAGIVLEDD